MLLNLARLWRSLTATLYLRQSQTHFLQAIEEQVMLVSCLFLSGLQKLVFGAFWTNIRARPAQLGAGVFDEPRPYQRRWYECGQRKKLPN